MTAALPRSVATLGYLGHARTAGGVATQAFAVVAAYALHQRGGFPLVLAGTGVVAAIAFWAVRHVVRQPAALEDREIVVDAFVGQMVALWPLSFELWWIGAPSNMFPWPGWVGAFVLFRLLLAWKPTPIRWAAARSGATGILLDDVAAGALAALAATMMAALAHGWLA